MIAEDMTDRHPRLVAVIAFADACAFEFAGRMRGRFVWVPDLWASTVTRHHAREHHRAA